MEELGKTMMIAGKEVHVKILHAGGLNGVSDESGQVLTEKDSERFTDMVLGMLGKSGQQIAAQTKQQQIATAYTHGAHHTDTDEHDQQLTSTLTKVV